MGILSQIRETKRLVILAQGNAASFHDAPIKLMKELLEEIEKIEELRISQIQKQILLAKINFEKYSMYAQMSKQKRELFMNSDEPGVKNHLIFCDMTGSSLTQAEKECVQFIEHLEEAKKTYLEKYKHLMGTLD
ncbi:MAG: hypothetical protein ACP5N2_00090 [Candidatus Nanoarchaeia archaeon]